MLYWKVLQPAHRPLAIFIPLALFLILQGCAGSSRRQAPVAVNGVIDAASWDFAVDGNLALKGEWKFSWLETDPAVVAPEYDDSRWDVFRVPGYWNAKTGSAAGHGWLRLRIKNLTGDNLGLYLKSANRSYALYANGSRIMGNGRPGTDAAGTIHQRLPLIAVLLPHSNDLVLSWHIANFAEFMGGAGYAFTLGTLPRVEDEVWSQRALILFLIGVILMTGAYHFILWAGRRREVSYLFFALFCLSIAVRMAVMNNFPVIIFPAADLFTVLEKTEFISTVLAWLCIQNFFTRLYPDEFPGRWNTILSAVAGVFIAAFLVSPATAFFHTLSVIPAQVFLVIACGAQFIFLARAVRKKRRGAVIVLGGLLSLFAAVVNEILFSNFAGITVSLVHFGMAAFIICQSIVLSLRYADTCRVAEHLSVNLRSEVDAQTRIITEKNDELLRLNEERTNFFINLAHETKTPLTLIHNYLHAYLNKKGTDPDLRVVIENIDKLRKDMVNYLDHEKLRRGQVFYDHTRAADVSLLLENKILLFAETAAKKSIRIEAHVEDNLLVNIDPYAFDRVINNLLDNAIRYTAEGGDIRATLAADGTEAVLTIIDNGKGISEEGLEHVFEPYYQISHQKRNIQGIGMGLSIVKRIIDGAGGSIAIHSRPGEGSAFTIRFPRHTPSGGEEIERVADLSPLSHEQATNTVAAKATGDAPVIMVVEDNELMRAFLVNGLGGSFHVMAAADGREALDILRDRPPPRLVISDIMMDGMDGYAFHDALMKQKRYHSIPFIFLTAKTGLDEKIKGLAKGAVDFIAKPFDLAELIARIDSLLNLTQSQKETTERDVADRVLQAIRGHAAASPAPPSREELCRRFSISDREAEVLSLLLAGKEDKEIGSIMHISYNTVRSHVKNIFHKCGVQNKIELFNVFRP